MTRKGWHRGRGRRAEAAKKHLYRVMWENERFKTGGLLNPSQQYTHSPKRTREFLKKAQKSWAHPAFAKGSRIYYEKVY